MTIAIIMCALLYALGAFNLLVLATSDQRLRDLSGIAWGVVALWPLVSIATLIEAAFDRSET